MSGEIMADVERWAALIRDVGLIVGVPTLIVVGRRFYTRQIAILKEHIEFLKSQQVDRAWTIVRAQQELHEVERKRLEARIGELQLAGTEKESELQTARDELAQVRAQLVELGNSREALESRLLAAVLPAGDAPSEPRPGLRQITRQLDGLLGARAVRTEPPRAEKD
jgi:hypothetical protein